MNRVSAAPHDVTDAPVITLLRHERKCRHCGLAYMHVDWIPNRVKGYCSRECERVVERSISAEETRRVRAREP